MLLLKKLKKKKYMLEELNKTPKVGEILTAEGYALKWFLKWFKNWVVTCRVIIQIFYIMSF